MGKGDNGEANVNKLLELCNEFAADRDSLLGIYACGDNNGGYYVVGEPWKFVEGFYNILERGLQPDAEVHTERVASSIISGIRKLISTGSPAAHAFVDAISADDDDEDEEDELDMSSAQCMSCEELVSSLTKSLADVGIDVEIKVKRDRRRFLVGGSDVAS